MMKNIRENEWISDGTDGGWFNGYYDNNGRTVERCESGDVRMMLTDVYKRQEQHTQR